MPRWETLAFGALGFVAGYYIVKHFQISGGRVI